MSQNTQDNGTVTALSVVGLVFGLIGMFGSFIPCLGVYALYVSIPATIAGVAALLIAKKNNAKQSLAIAAMTISLIGVSISGYQWHTINSATDSLRKATEEMRQDMNRR